MNKKTILIIAGFILVAVSIPAGVYLVQRQQTFKSRATQAASSGFTLTTSSPAAAVSQKLVVSLKANSDTHPANLFVAKLSFPKDKLQVESINALSFDSAGFNAALNSTKGQVSYNPKYDANCDNKIDNQDAILFGNGADGGFIKYWAQSAPNNTTGDISLTGGVPTPGFKTQSPSQPALMACITFEVKDAAPATIALADNSAIYKDIDNANILTAKNNVVINAASNVTSSGGTTYNLVEGWNVIGVSVNTQTTPAQFLQQTQGKCNNIRWFNPQGQAIEYSSNPISALNNRLNSLDGGKGYYLECSSAVSVTLTGTPVTQMPSLVDGPHQIVALPKGASMSAEEFLNQVSNDLDCMRVHQYTGVGWRSHLKGTRRNDFQMNDYEGYSVVCQHFSSVTYNLSSGLNFIGIPLKISLTPAQFLEKTQGKCNEITELHPTEGIRGTLNPPDRVIGGKPYKIRCNQAVTMTFSGIPFYHGSQNLLPTMVPGWNYISLSYNWVINAETLLVRLSTPGLPCLSVSKGVEQGSLGFGQTYDDGGSSSQANFDITATEGVAVNCQAQIQIPRGVVPQPIGGETMEIKTWVLIYKPPDDYLRRQFPVNSDYSSLNPDGPQGGIVNHLKTFTKDMVLPAWNEGTKYKGYSNPQAKAALNYTLADEDIVVENNRPPRDSWGYDYRELFTKYNLCETAKRKNIKAIIVWADGAGEYSGGKMFESAITGSRGVRTNGGNLSYCSDKTIVVYGLNYTRGLAEAMESHGHHIETVSAQVMGYDEFWLKFAGSKEGYPKHITGTYSGCGGVHDPPNARGEYDRSNPDLVLPGLQNPNNGMVETDCPDWKPDGTGRKTRIDCHTWGCTADGWIKWWMQNIPGIGNTLVKTDNTKMPNLWVAIGDPDRCFRNPLRCSGWTGR